MTFYLSECIGCEFKAIRINMCGNICGLQLETAIDWYAFLVIARYIYATQPMYPMEAIGWHVSPHDDVGTISAFCPFVRWIHRSPVNSLHKRPVTRSFDVFLDLRLNKRLGKQSWGWWFETPLRPLWHHCNENERHHKVEIKERNSIVYKM